MCPTDYFKSVGTCVNVSSRVIAEPSLDSLLRDIFLSAE